MQVDLHGVLQGRLRSLTPRHARLRLNRYRRFHHLLHNDGSRVHVFNRTVWRTSRKQRL